MSHIVTIKTELRDAAAIRAACRRLGLAAPVDGTHKLFNNQTAAGLAVQLPDWHYPVVCSTSTGQLAYDNYGGNWGKQEHLDRFIQAYAAEKTKMEARKKGFLVTETTLKDGSIRLAINTGG